MARTSRTVIPGVPHQVTQRGNRREPVFFGDADYRLYLRLVGQAARSADTAIWAYCLMPNHVHLILVPAEASGLRRALADAHRRYANIINRRFGWTGHLWQERFAPAPMDERHLFAALRYVAMNPVEARLVHDAGDWPWASTRAHLSGRSDGVVEVGPVLERTGDFRIYLRQPHDLEALADLRRSLKTGQPCGDDQWLQSLGVAQGR